MDDILKYCIKVNGVSAYYPMFNEFSSRILGSSPEMAMKYGWNNGKVSFVTEDGSYYVTPFSSEIAVELRKLGYTDGSLYVPFSNGDIPSDKLLAEKWETLCIEAKKQSYEKQEREKIEKYKTIAVKKHLKALPDEVYGMSLAIPKDGLETTWMGQDRIKTMPIIDSQITEHIGTYYYNNSKASFVDENGRMYVTPFTFEVIQMLRTSGYTQGNLFVPLSNGEQIVDPTLSTKWEKMCADARIKFYERQEREKRERYRKIAEEKNLSALPDEVYGMSLAIPDTGLTAVLSGQGRARTRIVDEWQIPEYIGSYCQNNSRVSFIDKNGKMFVTPFCIEIREMLSKAGYQEKDLFVPLSHGEEIVDPAVSEKWKAMCEKAREMLNQYIDQNNSGLRM